jgi:hypothetical protein
VVAGLLAFDPAQRMSVREALHSLHSLQGGHAGKYERAHSFRDRHSLLLSSVSRHAAQR